MVDFVAGNTKASPNAVFAGSVPYLMLAGNLMAGWQMARAAGRRGQPREPATPTRPSSPPRSPPRASARRAHPRQGAGIRDAIVEGGEAPPRLARRRSDPGIPATCRCLPILAKLPLPVIGSPLFIISNPKLVIEQCKAGIVGSMPRSTPARPSSSTSGWPRSPRRWRRTARIRTSRPRRSPSTRSCTRPTTGSSTTWRSAPKYKVPIVITSLGARTDINEAVHGWGGIVLHDIINNAFAKKAIEKGADGLIAVAAGAGGHAGVKSPFALIQEIRAVVRRPAGAVGLHRHRRRGARRAGDGRRPRLHRLGLHRHRGGARRRPTSRRSSRARRTTSSTRTSSPACTATTWRRRSALRGSTGQPARERPQQDELRRRRGLKSKAWKDIWGCGQGIGAVDKVVPARELSRARPRVRRRASAPCLEARLRRVCRRRAAAGAGGDEPPRPAPRACAGPPRLPSGRSGSGVPVFQRTRGKPPAQRHQHAHRAGLGDSTRRSRCRLRRAPASAARQHGCG